MFRVLLLLVASICVGSMFHVEAAEIHSVNGRFTLPPSHNDATSANTATSTTIVNMKSQLTSAAADEVIDSSKDSVKDSKRYYYHPVDDRNPQVIEEFDHRYLDGTYEFKYVLSNGVSRYEKSYWKFWGLGKKLLALKGFYSYPLKNHQFLTVFYTADENGYQQDLTKYTKDIPTLPKHLDIPQLEHPQVTSKPSSFITTTTMTRKPKTTTTQRPSLQTSQFNWIY